MEVKSNFRVRVMKYAHYLNKTTNDCWRVCILKAWQLYRLAKRMRTSIVSFYYYKTDGSVRHAKGTLQNVPVGATLKNGKKMTKPSYKTLAYFDVDKQSFRCFKVENLITVA